MTARVGRRRGGGTEKHSDSRVAGSYRCMDGMVGMWTDG